MKISILPALLGGLALMTPALAAGPAPDGGRELAALDEITVPRRSDRRSILRVHRRAPVYELRRSGQGLAPTRFKYHLGGTFAYNPADAPRHTAHGSPVYREFRPSITIQRRRFINPH